MKKVYTVCGSGVATSVMCATKIRNYFKEKGLEVRVEPISFGSLSNGDVSADAIVSVNSGLSNDFGIPVISGVSLLTGIGEEQTFQEVEKILFESN